MLDPFAGSGTTGHAVLELNADAGAERRFILIEQGRPERGDSYARSLTADRLQPRGHGRLGRRRARRRSAAASGSSTLDKKVDADALLSMEREELARHAHRLALRRRGAPPDALVTSPEDGGYKYLVAKNARQRGLLPGLERQKGNTDFTEETYEACAEGGEEGAASSRVTTSTRGSIASRRATSSSTRSLIGS